MDLPKPSDTDILRHAPFPQLLGAVLVSSNPSLIRSVEAVIEPIVGIDLTVVSQCTQVLEVFRTRKPLILIMHATTEADFPEILESLRLLVSDRISLAKLLISDVDDPVQLKALIRMGVADCLIRPLDLGRLAYLINILTIQGRTDSRKSNAGSAPIAGQPPALTCRPEAPRPVAEPAARLGNLMEQVVRIAPQDSTVLLQGETGTGKTRLAGLIHQLSARKEQPFLTINCGSLSTSLIESEMFGHVRGAFTGADASRVGKFEAVGNGTLFLDEIDSLPLPLQAKLLRAVEERVFEPVGSNRSQPMQARLIAASNQRLEDEVNAKRFRADLFYRLNVVTLDLPPLREQVATIESMAHSFLTESTRRSGRNVEDIDRHALSALQAYTWPGNIRELRNVIERAVVLSEDSTIRLEDLPPAVLACVPAPFHAPFPSHFNPASTGPLTFHTLTSGSSCIPSLASSKEETEKSRIAQALIRHKNNRLRTAAELGISRMTLYNKLHKYGLMDRTSS